MQKKTYKDALQNLPPEAPVVVDAVVSRAYHSELVSQPHDIPARRSFAEVVTGNSIAIPIKKAIDSNIQKTPVKKQELRLGFRQPERYNRQEHKNKPGAYYVGRKFSVSGHVRSSSHNIPSERRLAHFMPTTALNNGR